jgi:DNA-binding NtrC family response regulator
MKLGAYRDVQTPIHLEELRDIIKQACKARKKKRRKRAARRFIGAAPRIFAAVTFAEHGEFDTAKKCLDSDLERRENDE